MLLVTRANETDRCKIKTKQRKKKRKTTAKGALKRIRRRTAPNINRTKDGGGGGEGKCCEMRTKYNLFNTHKRSKNP